MSLLVLERHPVDPEHVDAFTEAVGRLLAQMRTAPGALWADAARAFDDEPSYLVLSEWRTEADAEAWASGDGAAEFGRSIELFLRGPVTRRRFAC